jgi:hypothetical protein
MSPVRRGSIAQHDAIEPFGRKHRAFQIANGVEGPLKLCGAGAGGARSGDQIRRSLGAQKIGRFEFPVEPPQIGERRQRGELMDDDLRSRLCHRGDHGGPVERVGDHRLGPVGAQPVGFVLEACHPGHLMARPQCERDKTTTHGAAGAGDEHPHR